ncbi:NnrS family protein [Sulfurimonas paralvinellae]|uniref:NnrS family protein n=1 Tax=Sulfurimonas paralvinellae TaxID=317658 RepID=A0A7M1B5E5_9BACT|nr:NnrS family protein [Sulfurimonas paralvinellae]QOP44953.1 NnrS family protein [Sulfurimonas paralvinellae]
MNKQTKQNYFLSQPHQPFFILGVANAIIIMLLFALAYKGVLSLTVDNTFFHVYTLIFLLFTNVFTGFLFTTFPRFNQTEVIDKAYYTKIFYANAIGSLLFLIGAVFNLYLLIAAMLIIFVAQIFIVKKLQTIFLAGRAPDKTDSFWILTAQYFGIGGHLLFLIAVAFQLPAIIPTAVNITFYLYLIFLAFSVGQRMIPFFSHSWAEKNPNFIKITFVLFIFKSIFASAGFAVGEIVVDIILASYMLKEFLRWDLHPFHSPSILWVLHLSLFWLPAAFALSAVSLTAELVFNTSFYFLNIHLLAIGFLTTVLIGFGTRVTLGHAGMPPHADRFATAIFLFIQLVVLLRTLFSLNIAFGWGANFLFDISFTAWLLLFIIWAGRYGKILIFGKST